MAIATSFFKKESEKNMKKSKIKINRPANNIMWVECWVQRVNPTLSFQICAEQNGDQWASEFVLPIVEKEVSVKAKTEVNAMLKAGTKAKKVIKEYIKSHPIYNNLVESYWCHNWEIKEDKEGHFLGLGRSSKARKTEGIEQSEKIGAAVRAIENALDKIAKLYGSSKGFFIHVIDKNAVDENVEIMDLEQEIWQNHVEQYHIDETSMKWSSVRLTDDNILLIFSIDPESLGKSRDPGILN